MLAGQEYFQWRVHQLKSAGDKGLIAQGAMSLARRSEPLSADDRAVLLGEQRLPPAAVQPPAAPAQVPPAAGAKAIAGGLGRGRVCVRMHPLHVEVLSACSTYSSAMAS